MRKLVAVFVVLLCVFAFFYKIYPLPIFNFQFVAALQSSLVLGFGSSIVFLVLVAVLTFLFGRVYCGALCPLGLYQELLMILFKPFYKKRKFKTQEHYILAYVLAAILYGFLFGGTVVFLRMFDPYSVAGNALSGAAFGLVFFLVLTVLVFFKKRFFCTNICPVGAVLGLISRFSLFKIRIDTDKCKMCTLCARSCPCGSIDFRNHNVNNETCIKCFECLAHCNHGALCYGLPKAKKVKFSVGRREFIKAGLLFALFGAACKGGIEFSKKTYSKIKNVILPAGAGCVEDFSNRCLNCNLCVKNCPMKVLEPASFDIPYVHINYKNNFCKYNCHRCCQVCPSGAIEHLTLVEKQKTKIATAVVNEDVCIKCGLCVLECPRQIIIKENGLFPIIPYDECIGCGSCASVCPAKAINIEQVQKQITIS